MVRHKRGSHLCPYPSFSGTVLFRKKHGLDCQGWELFQAASEKFINDCSIRSDNQWLQSRLVKHKVGFGPSQRGVLDEFFHSVVREFVHLTVREGPGSAVSDEVQVNPIIVVKMPEG